MSILDTIVANTRWETANRSAQVSIQDLERSPLFNRKPLVVADYIRDKKRSGIIAEIKRRSPSKGIINNKTDVVSIGKGYERGGASCISVLTDSKFFGGEFNYLTSVKNEVAIPVLRKDFILDNYQVIEAKAIGADMILLIAACLTPQEIRSLSKLAKSIGLSVLLEVHDEEELKRSLNPYLDLVGVNNRNLNTFEVSLDMSYKLAELIPSGFVKISESGIFDACVISALRNAGYEGFLIGELFMSETDPGDALSDFINKVNSYSFSDIDDKKFNKIINE